LKIPRRSYVMPYRVRDDIVEILRVLHEAQHRDNKP
jgi:plasmid stabilization system protein ParE